MSKFDEDTMQIVLRPRREGLPLGFITMLHGRPHVPAFPEFNLKDMAVVLDIEGDVGARLRRFAPDLGVTLAPPKLPDITIDSFAAVLEPRPDLHFFDYPPRQVAWAEGERWTQIMLQVLKARRRR